MTIVKHWQAYRSHEFTHLSPAWQARLIALATGSRVEGYHARAKPTVLALECLLQIIGDSVPRKPTDRAAEEKLTLLLGAINSGRFTADLDQKTTEQWSRAILDMVNRLRDSQGKEQLEMSFGVKHDNQLLRLVQDFESNQVDEEAVWVWSGWGVTNAAGKPHYLPLYPLYQRFGRQFTERLYTACDDYFSSSRSSRVPCIAHLANFIKSRPDITTTYLQAPHAGELFWRDFWAFYQLDSECESKTTLRKWTAFRTFAQEFLIAPNLFPSTYSRFPGPEATSKESPAPKDAVPVSEGSRRSEQTSILFDLSPDLNGSELWSYIETTCPATLSMVEKWAKDAIADSWGRHRQRKILARQDSDQLKTERSGSANARNVGPNRYIHAARLYETEGHPYVRQMKGQNRVWLTVRYPQPFIETSHYLGLPVMGTLFPYAAILVMEHPSITTSFLETLVLWDDNDRLTNLVKQNGIWYLIGIKWRSGERVGEQRVPLNSKTLRIIWKVISITTPLRKCLKKNNDAAWKHLFLESGKGFSLPKVVSFAMVASVPTLRKKNEERFVRSNNMKPDEARRLVARLTLQKIRRTTGINIFIVTRNPYTASKALGHDNYQPALFSRYVPPQINALAYELVIRDLQTSIVAKSMEKSPYLLKGTGFKSHNELQDFLEHNAFPEINSLSQAIREQNDQIIRAAKRCESEIIFSVSLETLIPITSVVAAIESKSFSISIDGARTASFAHAIIGMLDARAGLEPSIDAIVKEAKAKADVELVKDALCA